MGHGVDRDRPAKGEQQRMVIARPDEGGDRDNGIGSGTIFDHDRLAPALGQPVRVQARRDIGRATGPERHDQVDRPLRPGIGARR